MITNLLFYEPRCRRAMHVTYCSWTHHCCRGSQVDRHSVYTATCIHQNHNGTVSQRHTLHSHTALRQHYIHVNTVKNLCNIERQKFQRQTTLCSYVTSLLFNGSFQVNLCWFVSVFFHLLQNRTFGDKCQKVAADIKATLSKRRRKLKALTPTTTSTMCLKQWHIFDLL